MRHFFSAMIVASTVAFMGGAQAGQEVVDGAAMDRIFARESQKIQLADRRHDGKGRGGHLRRGGRDLHKYGRRSHRRYYGRPYYRPYYKGGRRYYWGDSYRNDWVGPALAGAIVGAIVADQNNPSYTRDGDDYTAAKRRCDSKYRSYDWESDTYVTYGGNVKLCPYVEEYYR